MANHQRGGYRILYIPRADDAPFHGREAKARAHDRENYVISHKYNYIHILYINIAYLSRYFFVRNSLKKAK